MSLGADRLGHQAVRRTGVELLDDPERGRAGDLVAGPDGVLHRGGAAPGGQHREVQVDPAVLAGCRAPTAAAARRRRPPGSSRDRARAAPSWKSGSRGWSGLSTGTPSSSARSADRRGDQPAATTGRRVRPGDHADQLVPAGGDGLQRRKRRPRGCRRRRRARPRARGRWWRAGEILTWGVGWPNHSASRMYFIASLRASRSSRSMNRIPSRWSVSCWMARESISVPSMVTGSPYMSKPRATTESARLQSMRSSGIDRQPSGPSWISSERVSSRVDEVAELAVDVPGEHPQADAELRRGQAGAGRVEHRVGQVRDEGAQLLVEVDHRRGGRAQHRVAEQPDRPDGHGRPPRGGVGGQSRSEERPTGSTPAAPAPEVLTRARPGRPRRARAAACGWSAAPAGPPARRTARRRRLRGTRTT